MIRLLYFNIFFVLLYFLFYFQHTTDYLLAGGFIAFIAFCVLLLKQENQLVFKNNALLTIGALLAAALLIEELWALYRKLEAIDLEYLSWRTGSFVVLTTVFCITIILQLIYYIRNVVIAGKV